MSFCYSFETSEFIVRISGLLLKARTLLASVRFLEEQRFQFSHFEPSIQALQMHGPVCKCPVRKLFLPRFQRTSGALQGLAQECLPIWRFNKLAKWKLLDITDQHH